MVNNEYKYNTIKVIKQNLFSFPVLFVPVQKIKNPHFRKGLLFKCYCGDCKLSVPQW